MKTRLIEIINILKQIKNETNLNVSDDELFVQSCTYHRGESINESRKNYIQNKEKSYPSPSNEEFKGKDKSISQKQINLMTKLKIPFTKETTSKQAYELINQKIGENKNKY